MIAMTDAELARAMQAAGQLPESKRQEFLECAAAFHERLHTDIDRAIDLALAYLLQRRAGTALT